MAVLELSDQPFFSNKNRAFWNLHSVGWGGALILRGATGLANGQTMSFFVPLMISAVTGYSITLLLSVIYRMVIERRPVILWLATAASVAVGAAMFAYIDAWVLQTIRQSAEDTPFAQLLLGALYVDTTLIGAWTALYFAINFYVRAEEQADQMLRLEAQATSAQLTMLRYQLNPHFLFNTLNSLSSLVIKGDNARAEEMIQSLSGFYRTSLSSDPLEDVTLIEEVELQQRYLEIEAVRYPERLRVVIDIPAEVQNTKVPGMILQPLVENAIKYGVSRTNRPVTVRIAAERVGNAIQISVTDDGDTIATKGRSRDGNGIGLANVRDRIEARYGERGHLLAGTQGKGGFAATITIADEDFA